MYLRQSRNTVKEKSEKQIFRHQRKMKERKEAPQAPEQRFPCSPWRGLIWTRCPQCNLWSRWICFKELQPMKDPCWNNLILNNLILTAAQGRINCWSKGEVLRRKEQQQSGTVATTSHSLSISPALFIKEGKRSQEWKTEVEPGKKSVREGVLVLVFVFHHLTLFLINKNIHQISMCFDCDSNW